MSRFLRSDALQLEFSDSGELLGFTNLLTRESHACRDAGFTVVCPGRSHPRREFACRAADCQDGVLTLLYEGEAGTVRQSWTLAADAHFAESRLSFRPAAAMDLERLVLFDFALAPEAEKVELVEYRYIDFAVFDEMPNHRIWDCYRDADTEPSRLAFGRTGPGGFFIGLEAAFDVSEIQPGRIRLAIRPMLHLAAGETLEAEAAFLGVYRKQPGDELAAAEWQSAVDRGVFTADFFKDGVLNNELVRISAAGGAASPSPDKQPLYCRPLPAESRAVTAMTSRIMGPPRFGVMALACGWHCDMCQEEYSEETLAGDLKALEIIAECGMDGLSDPHPWGGETGKMNALREGDRYVPGDRVRRMAERARELELGLGQWPTFNQTHPWRPFSAPFRPDRLEWQREIIPCENPNPNYENFRVRPGNCLGAYGFSDWLLDIYRDAMDSGYYRYSLLDGDFWGTGAYSTTTIPVECASHDHRHLPVDANYVCQQALQRIVDMLRREYPGTYIFQCRPAMDLGIWALKGSDACFTLIEAGSGSDNLAAGNAIRTSSRVRVHQHFIPHWLDSSLLFPSHYHPSIHPAWPRDKAEFVLLSALASTPNLLFYLPTAHTDDFLPEDRRLIREWLEWGRANQRYLMVRHDFPDWPSPWHPDGTAHLIDGEGWIFWFNSAPEARQARFRLDAGSSGFSGRDRAKIREFRPIPGEEIDYAAGDEVVWTVPPESALVLRVN